MSNDKYWMVNHDPDLTETGCATRRTYIKTTWTGFPAQQANEQEIVEDFCFERWGSTTADVIRPAQSNAVYLAA